MWARRSGQAMSVTTHWARVIPQPQWQRARLAATSASCFAPGLSEREIHHREVGICVNDVRDPGHAVGQQGARTQDQDPQHGPREPRGLPPWPRLPGRSLFLHKVTCCFVGTGWTDHGRSYRSRRGAEPPFGRPALRGGPGRGFRPVPDNVPSRDADGSGTNHRSPPGLAMQYRRVVHSAHGALQYPSG